MTLDGRVSSSFRDPSGELFWQDGALYRKIYPDYLSEFNQFIQSGLSDHLIEVGLLIPHEDATPQSSDVDYKLIRPETVPFISYPYEWSFSQIKDAALCTLELQKRALEHGMTLKDSSAYNIQYHKGRPLLIDTLSFEQYNEGAPWTPYKQFCQHFLAPLLLMSRVDIRFGKLYRDYIDGIPLDLASRLLPRGTWLRPGIALHIHAHAASQKRYADRSGDIKPKPMSRQALMGLIDSLESIIKKLSWTPAGTEWAEYYASDGYAREASDSKHTIIASYLDRIQPDSVWDLGANTGVFSRIASDRGIPTISFDIDPACVERSYLQMRKAGEEHLLPLVMDLTNPSPALGWASKERDGLAGRGPAHMVFALALMHHLAVSNNVPFPMIAEFFGQLGRTLIIEFVPKHDAQVQRLLASRKDIFTHYTQEAFEQAFGLHFEILDASPVQDSERILYLMRARSTQ